MNKLDSIEEYKGLRIFGICKDKLERTRDFSKAWEASLIEARQYLAIDDGDYDTILWFGRLLGTTDIEGEMANCRRYGELLSERLKHARDEQKKRGRMYTSLGILVGVFFVVFFI
jgi:stage III sporulation protein AB